MLLLRDLRPDFFGDSADVLAVFAPTDRPSAMFSLSRSADMIEGEGVR